MEGVIAKNVDFAKIIGEEYIGVDKNGQVICSVDGVADAVKDWTGIQDIYLSYSDKTGVFEVKAINEANQLLYYHSEGETANYPTENLLRVYYETVACLDGKYYDATGAQTSSEAKAMISYYELPVVEETTEETTE